MKNDCSVCAARWTTRSPSMRPGQPRSSSWPRGVNMQSLTHGSVCTITSATSGAPGGSAPRPRSRARARPRACPGSRPSVRKATRPSSVRRKRSSRGAGRLAADASTTAASSRLDLLARRRPRSAARGASARPSTSGTARTIAPSTCSRSRAPPRAAGRPAASGGARARARRRARHVRLWISRTRGTASAAACTRSRRPPRRARLDVDDDVALGQRRARRLLDPVRDRVALPDAGLRGRRRSRRRRSRARRLAQAQPPQVDRRLDRARSLRAPPPRVRGRPVHQHVDVAAHQPAAATSTSAATKSAATESPCGKPAAAREAGEHGDRAGEVAAEVERVRASAALR